MADDTLPNTQIVPVVQFAPDPRGLFMFGALVRRNLRDFGRRAVIDARGSGDFGGAVATPQQFTGLAGLLGGRRGGVQVSRTNSLVNERSTEMTPAMDAFYDQLRRRQT